MSARNALLIPDAALQDPNSFEFLRVWVANKALHVSLAAGVWKDPAALGILLADLARHVASACEQNAGLDKRTTLERIKDGFGAEFESPTDEPSGSVRN
jgi:Domain of unknown function (DUF5076)